jgi:hypothetical protein
MELLTLLVADYANIAQGGKLNVMGIFRNISANNFPVQHPSMVLIIKLGAEFGEYGGERSITVIFANPDGKELLRFNNPITVPQMVNGQRPEMNIILEINNTVFPEPGRYQFIVMVDKDTKGTLALDVNKTDDIKNLPS